MAASKAALMAALMADKKEIEMAESLAGLLVALKDSA